MIQELRKKTDRKTSSSVGSNFSWLGGLIQTTDTLFPSGGYAHSCGLEERIALGTICSMEDLEDFLHHEILPTLEKMELPYLRFCFSKVELKDYNSLLHLNEEISALKLTREIREAGISQGTQMIRMIREIYQCPITENFERLLNETGEQAQQITTTALLRNAQSIPLTSTLIAWVYQAVSNFCSASVKLLRLGEVACQKAIHRCMEPEKLSTLLSASMKVKKENAGFFNPLLDIASARHELAFSRLFIS
jgi:urease accessory protein